MRQRDQHRHAAGEPGQERIRQETHQRVRAQHGEGDLQGARQRDADADQHDHDRRVVALERRDRRVRRELGDEAGEYEAGGRHGRAAARRTRAGEQDRELAEDDRVQPGAHAEVRELAPERREREQSHRQRHDQPRDSAGQSAGQFAPPMRERRCHASGPCEVGRQDARHFAPLHAVVIMKILPNCRPDDNRGGSRRLPYIPLRGLGYHRRPTKGLPRRPFRT